MSNDQQSSDSSQKRYWHQLFTQTLQELLKPVDIQVISDVEVVAESPRADIIILRKEGEQWSSEQKQYLADGIRDVSASHVLLEFKFTESLNDAALLQLLIYDQLYMRSANLDRHELQSILVSAKTPNTDVLDRFGFEPMVEKGVYVSSTPWMSTLRVILLNQLVDEPHNAAMKCFSSRLNERERAFLTILKLGFHKISSGLFEVFVRIGSMLMNRLADHPEMKDLMEKSLLELGYDMFNEMFEKSPEGFLKHPKLQKKIADSREEGREEGREEEKKANLIRLLANRFGPLSQTSIEKVNNAPTKKVAEWMDRLFDVNSLDEILY